MDRVEQLVAFRVCDYEGRNTRGMRRPEMNALVDKMDPCYQPHILEPVVLARDTSRFTIRVTPSMVRELKNVITSMIEERTVGLPIKNMVGDIIWPRPGFGKSPSQKARCRLLVDWHKAILATLEQKGLKELVEVLNECWKCTVNLRKRDAGEQARAAVVATGTSEHVFSTELVTELMAGTTEMEVRETVSRQRALRWTRPPMEFVYLHTVTANLQRRKRAEERVQQLQSKVTEAWDSCVLLMREVGDMGETAQHKHIITEGTGDTAIGMPSSFTSYILRHYPETRATLVQLFDRVFLSYASSVCSLRK